MFRVLLPVDSDEKRALTAAEAIISLPNANETVHVTILNAEPEVDITDVEGTNVRSEEWYDENKVPPSANKVMEFLENKGIATKMRREHTDPTKAIIEAADDIDADRIIMSGRRRSPTGKVLFGSVTQSVLLSSSIPVTVVLEE